MVRHGQPDEFNGNLTDEGIKTITKTAAVLYDMYENPRYAQAPYADNKNDNPISLTELCQVASLRWPTVYTSFEGNYAALHASCPPNVVLTTSEPRVETTGEVLEIQLNALGAKPKLYKGVQRLADFETNSSGISFDDQICLLKRDLQNLWEQGNQHIVLVTHQPTIAKLAEAFVAGGADIPAATYGSILSFYVEKPEHLWDKRRFLYGRTGVCEWIEEAPKEIVGVSESAEQQVQRAMHRDYGDKLLSVFRVRQQLNNNKNLILGRKTKEME